MIRDNFGRDVVANYSTTEAQCAAEMFPVGILFDQGAINHWMVTYLQLQAADMSQRLARWTAFQDRVLKEITEYKVPVIRLTKGTSWERVLHGLREGQHRRCCAQCLRATYGYVRQRRLPTQGGLAGQTFPARHACRVAFVREH